MNYRHSYHAGNFADVLKHAVLAQIITYLKRKDQAFRVIDTHAGVGLYDLSSAEAQKTGEWRGGIGTGDRAELSSELKAFLGPWLEAVEALNPEGGVLHYPGSPKLTRALLRKQDRLTAIELHPEDAKRLRQPVRRGLPGAGHRTRRLAVARRASAAKGETRPGADRPALRASRRV
jgi:23S rRNA (adenine2030-N6)-methyltransferase